VPTLELGNVLNPLPWWMPYAQCFVTPIANIHPFVLPLFVRVGVEINEGCEFTVGPINGGFESIKVDVRVDGRVE